MDNMDRDSFESKVESHKELKSSVIKIDLKEYVESFNSSEREETTTHYVCECKNCVEIEDRHDHKLYIIKDYSMGYCFRCESSYFNLTKEVSDIEKYTKIPPLKKFNSNSIDYPEIDTSYYYESNEIDSISADYLKKRNPYLDYKKYELRCRKNRIVIPFYYGDAMLYYQIRFIDPIGNKYFNPVTNNKPIYMLPSSDITDTAILAEGTFDVMALDSLYDNSYTKLGLLGKTVTASQMKLLKYYGFSKILISLDETELSLKLRAKLVKELKISVDIIDTKLDPEEHLRLL